MTRRRNLSPWAYWQLRLAATPTPAPVSRADLLALVGPPPVAVEADFEVTDSVDCGGYRRDRVLYDVEAGMTAAAYLLTPHDRRQPGPALLAIHGHGAGKSMVCNIDDGDPQRRAEIDGYNGDYAHQLAQLGYVVLAPDLRTFGERRDPQWDPDHSRYDCDWNLVCAAMAGVNPLAQNLWDMQRSIDVLSALATVDPQRIGVVGLSYGATMTLFLAAIDERVRAAVVSGYVSSWRSAHRVPWNMCGSQVLWGQLGCIEHVDLVSMVMPRAMLIESGTDDVIFPVDAAIETVASVRARCGETATRRLVHDVQPGGHRWYGTQVAEFLARELA